MGLFDIFKKTQGQTKSNKEPDPDFFSKNIKKIGEMRDRMSDCYAQALACQEFDLKIALLQKALQYHEEFRAWCYQSEGGKKYFYDKYEHAWNDNIKEFYSKKEMFENELNRALFVRNNIVPEIIKLASAPEGILQKDIYQHFQIDKKDLQKIIAEMENEKLIRKEKSGNSYLIKK